MRSDYRTKFDLSARKSLYYELDQDTRDFIRHISFKYRLTFQEIGKLVSAARDLDMWDEITIRQWMEETFLQEPGNKDVFLGRFGKWFEQLKQKEKEYGPHQVPQPPRRETKITVATTDKKVSGPCPVSSPETMCCLLRTIDAVEHCPYGCTYCTIQTFYGDDVLFDSDFGRKVRAIELDPHRFYHFGSGQSSDSLAWGNRNGILEDLLGFAAMYPNILLELKTKSQEIDCLLRYVPPRNLVCSWSLNPDTIIRNEEFFTPLLAERLSAARRVADRGIKVAFHFHPMIYYRGWREEYGSSCRSVMENFRPEEVLFISFGSLTLIKPVIREVRKRGLKTKILQMPMVSDPKGKSTYPDHIKISMFRYLYDAFIGWHDSVYFYLCMEKSSIWQEVFGYVYTSNQEFEQDFGRRTMPRL